MATIAIPTVNGPFAAASPTSELAAAINAHLWEKHRIEVPVIAFAGRLWVRISAQIYNHIGDYRRLAAALAA